LDEGFNMTKQVEVKGREKSELISMQAPQIGTTEEKGENARLQSFVGAIAIGDLIKTTLGPKGMDKILQSMDGEGPRGNSITVTNDGATILKSIWYVSTYPRLLYILHQGR
jgi:hypothetical protein